MGRRRRRADDARPRRRRRRHLVVCAAAPADAAGAVALHLALPPPGTSATPPAHRDSGLQYEYYSLALGGVRPAAVPLGGGRLRVALAVGASASLRTAIRDGHGRCTVEYSDGTAIDGGAAVAAAHASAEEVVCVAPAAAAPGDANVSVSLDEGRTYVGGGAVRYHNVSARRASPAGGPVHGGTTVTVDGGGLDGGAPGGGACRFGAAAATPLSLLSPTQALCVAPAHVPELGVASRGRPLAGDASARGGIGEASHPSDGSGRFHTGRPHLSFNDERDRDRAPALATALALTVDGGEDYLDEATVPFTFYSPPTVSSIAPADGPAAGGFVVTVRGEGFGRLGLGAAADARCRFGATVTAVHRIVNGSYLECASPQLPEAVEWWRENASEPAAAGAFAEASAPGGGGYGSGDGGGRSAPTSASSSRTMARTAAPPAPAPPSSASSSRRRRRRRARRRVSRSRAAASSPIASAAAGSARCARRARSRRRPTAARGRRGRASSRRCRRCSRLLYRSTASSLGSTTATAPSSSAISRTCTRWRTRAGTCRSAAPRAAARW